MMVCVDASLVLKWLTYEAGSDEAIAWLSIHADDELIAPAHLPVEVASVLRQKARRGEITHEDGMEALQLLNSLNIRLTWDHELTERAFTLATELDQATVYDTAYLALAAREQSELWTADDRFARAASPRYPFVRGL